MNHNYNESEVKQECVYCGSERMVSLFGKPKEVEMPEGVDESEVLACGMIDISYCFDCNRVAP